ncbi:MAG: NADH-quinone oxidoreductase subunit J [Ignavibacteriaceae bacterium]|nr:NADH-quinone oxidoreductase subunit J [Ignavibacteriaceae bacterium]
MELAEILFLAFASIAVVTAIFTVISRSPVISALFLVINFGALSGLYLLLSAQFLSVVQVIVYAGAIMVLFLFVLMLLRPEKEDKYFVVNRKMKIFAVIVGLFLFGQLAFAIFASDIGQTVSIESSRSEQIGKIAYIGENLYTTYLFPFEAIAFVLLVATIGAIVISKKKLD